MQSAGLMSETPTSEANTTQPRQRDPLSGRTDQPPLAKTP